MAVEFLGDTLVVEDGEKQARFVWGEEPRAVLFGGDVSTRLLTDEAPRSDWKDEKFAAYAGFRGVVDSEIVGAVEAFTSHQWPLMRLAKMDPYAMDLATSNPVLAWALANNAAVTKRGGGESENYNRRLSRSKQREILEYLGFPGHPFVVKLFTKIDPQDLTLDQLRLFRAYLSHEIDSDLTKQLCHLPRVSSGIINLILNQQTRPLIGKHLLDEVSALTSVRESNRVVDRLIDVQWLREQLGEAPRRQVFRSIHDVSDDYDAVFERLQEKEAEQLAYARRVRLKVLGDPPYPGTEDIVPITTVDDLIEEGSQQWNCVATYAHQVQLGSRYIYRVFNPERATLCLSKTPSGWKIRELEAKRNTPAGPLTWDAVRSWMRTHSIEAW